MDIDRVDERTYNSWVAANVSHVFNTAAFNQLNVAKCDEIHFLLFGDGKYRGGIVLGQKEKAFLSPFSAPFGGFESVRSDLQIHVLDGAVESLKSYVVDNGGDEIRLTLPPHFYDGSMSAKTINSLFRGGFSIDKVDVNHSVELSSWKPQSIRRQSGFVDLDFRKCGVGEEEIRAYEIIRANRTHRGYPLRMSLDQVLQTIRLVDADFFLVAMPDGAEVASAMVYHLAKDIVQVIYWGNLPGYDHFRPMQFLALRLFEYYREHGCRIVDIGPSSENSIPNYGLCDFKERIGCQAHPKFSFVWRSPCP